MSLQQRREQQGNRLMICYAEAPGCGADFSALRVMNQAKLPALLPCAMLREGALNEARWDVTGRQALSERLSQPLSASELSALAASIAGLIDGLVQRRLPIKNLVLDPGSVFVNAAQPCALSFIYLPFHGVEPDLDNARSFFEGIGRQARAQDGAARAALNSYLAFFQHADHFDILGLSRHMSQVAAAALCDAPATVPAHGARPDDTATTLLDAPDDSGTTLLAGAPPDDAGTTLLAGEPEPDDTRTTLLDQPGVADAALQPADDGGTVELDEGAHAEIPGKGLTGVLDQLDLTQYSSVEELYADADDVPPTEVVDAPPEPAPVPESEPAPAPEPAKDAAFESALVPTPESEPAPAPESAPAPAPASAPEPAPTSKQAPAPEPAPAPAPAQPRFYLTDLRTNDRFELRGRHFVVGKSKHSTYQVRDTNTVSRSHAIFCVEGASCTITDDSSRNGSFVNGERLEPQLPRELADGDTVRLSDVDFVFEAVGEA